MPVYEDLRGRVALVTGASSGIGRATAIALAKSAANVAVNFWNNEDGAADTVAAIEKSGGHAWAVRADVSRSEECRALVEAVQRRFGGLHLLVNNAGSLVERMGLLEMTEERWDTVLNLNLKSAFLCTQAAVPIMLQQKQGVVVNVTSIAARNGGGRGVSHYAAAKAGLIAFSKNVAREFAPQGIRVNCISPGFIDTPFHDQFSTPDIKKALLASIPMGRAGTPEEAAEVVAFLCSDVSSYVCGETIETNGGLLML